MNSRLKCETLDELLSRKKRCEESITDLNAQLAEQIDELERIEYWLRQKTPRELTLVQIESLLGYKITLKDG